MATTIEQPYVTVNIPMKDFNLISELAKKLKWTINTPVKTGMEKAFDDVKYGRVSVLHTPKNWRK
ncbi:MAG: hypothetical protein LBU90_03820 [Bacteroidales bacterium]|nr:hypothetical protein [Bacteroidales bacterium]